MLRKTAFTLSVASSLLTLAACDHQSPDIEQGTVFDPTDKPLPEPPPKPQAVYEKAGGCYALQDRASGKFLTADGGGGLVFDGDDAADAQNFTLKASGLGTFVFYDQDERFMSLSTGNEALTDSSCANAEHASNQANGAGHLLAIVGPAAPAADGIGAVTEQTSAGGCDVAGAADTNATFQMTAEPVNGSDWALDLPDEEEAEGYTLTSIHYGNALATSTDDGGVNDRYNLVAVASDQCTPYPEAQLNATGTPFKGTNPDGTVFGWAETHMHLGGSDALGGKLSYGRPYHKFGIIEALKNCSEDHGENGEKGILDVAVDSQTTVPNHDTVGWPTFVDWPTYSGQTHHQTYYMWVKRAWMSGLRFMMNHLVANEMLCNVWAEKQHDCNEMVNAKLQYDLILGMQHYIDAQEGGPGKGFFRIVRSSAEARQVIEEGKLAVVLGIELEKAFDCGEYLDSPECTEEEIDERVQYWYDLGLRAVFPIHIFDNAFGGAEIARFTKDPPIMNLYNQGNFVETGHYYGTIPCDEAEQVDWDEAETQDRSIFELAAMQAQSQQLVYTGGQVEGCRNNSRTLTSRGEYIINKLIDYGMFIEADHSGPLARKRFLDIARQRNIGVVSGHTGAITHARDSKRMMEIGSMISHLSDDPAPVAIKFFQDMRDAWVEVHGSTDGLSTGLGSDINGIHRQSHPRDDVDEKPLEYPFQSYDGNVTFHKQVTGDRVYDINVDGVAHYGLYPDYIKDMQITEGGEEMMEYLFKSAEGYLQLWERLEAERDRVVAETAN